MLELQDLIKKIEKNEIEVLDLLEIGKQESSDYETGVIVPIAITDKVLEQIAKALTKNHTIREITIRHISQQESSRIGWTHKGAEAIGFATRNLPRLTSFNLHLSHTADSQAFLGFYMALTGAAPIASVMISINAKDITLLNQFAPYLAVNSSVENISVYLHHSHNAKYTKENISLTPFADSLKERALTEVKFVNCAHGTLTAFDLEYGNACKQVLLKDVIEQLTSLESLVLKKYNVENMLPYVKEALKEKSKLRKVKISADPINEMTMEGLLSTFSKLPSMNELVLDHAALGAEPINCLIEAYKKNRLAISKLAITHNDQPIAVFLPALLDGNEVIKEFNMSHNGNNIFSKELGEMLADPKRCKLHKFIFDTHQFCRCPHLHQKLEEFYQGLEYILSQNPNLYQIASQSAYLPASVINSMDKNYQKYLHSQKTFIAGLIELCNLYYSQYADDNAETNLFDLPVEAFLLIISAFGQGTLGMSEKDVQNCCILVQENLGMRRLLMHNNDYSPNHEVNAVSYQSKEKGIWRWWSQKTRNQEETRIFKSCNTHPTLFAGNFDKSSVVQNKIVEKPNDKKCLVM